MDGREIGRDGRETYHDRIDDRTVEFGRCEFVAYDFCAASFDETFSNRFFAHAHETADRAFACALAFSWGDES